MKKTNLSKNKAVIFDFDGTLVDTFPQAFEIINHLSDSYGYDKVHIKDIDELRNLSFKQFINLFDIPIYKSIFVLKKVQKLLNEKLLNLNFEPGILDVINKLIKKNYKIGIISSNTTKNINDFLKLKNNNSFDFVYGGVIPYTKHFVIKKAIKKYNLDRLNSYYVGDEIRDIKASYKSVITPISVTWGFSSKDVLSEHNPHRLVDYPKEILNIINSK